METTTLSSRGQIVIPEKFRKGFEVGASFVVTKVDNLLVFKPLQGLSSKEEEDLRAISKAWKEIDSGKAKTYTEKEFFKAMKQW